jgi:hypothetical protein
MGSGISMAEDDDEVEVNGPKMSHQKKSQKKKKTRS